MVRTDLGREIIVRMLQDGSIIGRSADEDPDAVALMRRLSIVSRRRWPKEGYGDRAVTVGVPPPKKKKAAAPKPEAPADGEAKAAADGADGAGDAAEPAMKAPKGLRKLFSRRSRSESEE